MSIKLSISMIVKNEELLLSKCLESVKEADEIVICDTGSTDKTIEIAKKYTDKVFTDYKWNDDFSEAKNHALSKVSSNWILAIDADEELITPIREIKDLISKNPDADAIMVILDSKASREHFRYPRIFKNDPKIKFKYIKHARLEGTNKRIESEIIIKYGFSPAHRDDPDRGLRMSIKAVEQNPTSSRDLYYLAREYFIMGDFSKAIQEWQLCIVHTKRKDERADAFLCMAKVFLQIKNPEAAKEYAFQAIVTNIDFKEASTFLSKLANNNDVLFIREGYE